MIDFSQLISLGFLVVAVYFVLQFKEAVEILKNANFSNYRAYKEAVREGERKTWKPIRKSEEQGIRRVVGDRQKISLKGPNGIVHTQDTLVPLHEADPEELMSAVDNMVSEGGE